MNDPHRLLGRVATKFLQFLLFNPVFPTDSTAFPQGLWSFPQPTGSFPQPATQPLGFVDLLGISTEAAQLPV